MPDCILSIAVPTFNMERWLRKNLNTYADSRLSGLLEVICLNNASEDSSKEIICEFVEKMPSIFRLVDRSTRGYGSSINEAIKLARGKYFRIVDADDWVNTEQLIQLVDALKTVQSDIVLTDYQMVNLQTGSCIPVKAGERGAVYKQLQHEFSDARKALPSIHSTTYRTALLRETGFFMQDNMFFVDEEYVILPYLNAESIIFYPYDVYRYQVADPNQSTSPGNRAKYQEHREKILRRLIAVYEQAVQDQANPDALEYCFQRIGRGAGDHFTTLYIYVEDRKAGREMANLWKACLRQTPFWTASLVRKERILRILNYGHISLESYQRWKKRAAFLYRAV